jgi:hypothetical protein
LIQTVSRAHWLSFIAGQGFFEAPISKGDWAKGFEIGAHQNGRTCFYTCVVNHGTVHAMAESKGMSESKSRGLGRWFPTVAQAAEGALGATRLETLEILTDMEQLSDMFASFEDVRHGRIVNMSDAFGDL